MLWSGPSLYRCQAKNERKVPSTLYTALLAVILGKLQHGLSREK